MSDKELLAQIAQLAGAINKHRAQSQGYHGYSPHPAPARGGYSGYNGYNAYGGHTGYNMRGRGRGRGAPFPHAAAGPFNRSLTLNNNTPTLASSTSSTTSSTSTVTPATVAAKAIPALTPVQSMQPRPIINKSFVPTPAPSCHLTLVNKNTANTSITPGPLPSPASSPPKTNTLVTSPGQQWIQSKGKNMSLMNASTFQKTMVAKEKSIRTAKEKKLKLKLMQIKAKRTQDLRRGIVTMGGQEYSKSADGRKLIMRDTSQDNVVINGVEFRMDPRGNKLVRAAAAGSATVAATTTGNAPSVATTSSKAVPVATPKQFSIGGVVYVRTHSGNLVRANLVKKQLLEKRAAVAQQSFKTKRSRMVPKKTRPFCKYYTRFGICSRDIGCPFVHSRSHLAICKKFLRGVCPNTEVTCKLSHTPSPHTVPACVHFQRAACNKDDCVYSHVRTNPQAPICRPFATEGWCEAGINCKNRHVWVCPDFATEAGCKKKCGLPHVHNGGIRVKKSSDGNDIASGGFDKTWTRPDYQPSSSSSTASTSRYMDKQDQDAESGSGADGTATAAGRDKNRQYDENFIPLDLGDDFENQQAAMLDEDEDVVMSDQEVEEEEDEEEEEDVSSDGMETGADDDDDEGEEVSLEDSEEVDLEEDEDDDGEEMNEEEEYNMYQDQLRYEDEDDY
ncbi:hypothetical protein BGZ96_000549 [Linnemannia gamsii]|uniref:C3H1-type domain-containing protein n=1 Tax=Linnemannia gamsii TaxID=64522 RepID=A0ABQ7JNU3_9FUNG|nr:hypothetical protein BGZ96_000549 [Linnemannia gamsii]